MSTSGIKPTSEFSRLGDAINRLLSLKPAEGSTGAPSEVTPSATSQPPATSPAPRIASKSPSPLVSDGALSDQEILSAATEAGRAERERRKELLRRFGPCNRPYEPLTQHRKFQRETVENPDYDKLLHETYSRVNQDPDPDPFFLIKATDEKACQPCPPLPGPSGFGMWQGWRRSDPPRVRSGSMFPAKQRLVMDPHTALSRSRRWGGPDGIPYDYRHIFTAKRSAVVNYIAKYQKRDGKCTAANATIARKVGVSIRTVQRAKSDLKQFAVEIPRRVASLGGYMVKSVGKITDRLWLDWLSYKGSKRQSCHLLENINEDLSSFFVRPAWEIPRTPP